MFDAIARVLAFFYEQPIVGGSYGVAIILLTAAVMIVLMPLTLRATRSTIRMQEVQPKLKELQKKHKDDKQTLNTELMALYQENGINPVGGCLPMVAQLPVFLVLFNVLRGLSRRVSEAPFFTITNEARIRTGSAVVEGGTFDPKYLSVESDMYRDLSTDTEMSFGPFDLAAEGLDVLRDNFLSGLPYVVLILFVVFTSYYQQRQVAARRSGGAMMNPQQEMILKFLPLLSGIWSFIFPAGLVLYWATSNVFRIGQQGYITRAFYGEGGEGSRVAEAAAEAAANEADEAAAEKKAAKNGKSGNAAGSDGDDANKASAGRNGRGPKKPASSNGSNGSSAGAPEDREAAWAERRRSKARAQAAKKGSEPSSRVTPKGTKPGGQKKKRKR